MGELKYAIKQTVLYGVLFVAFSDGTVKHYDAVELGCEWFKMSNDAFYSMYGFNFNPHEFGLYEKCRRIVHGDLA